MLPPPPKTIYFKITGQVDDGEKVATVADRYEKFQSTLRLRSYNLYWPKVTQAAEKWARALMHAREEFANTPDLWTELSSGRELLAGLYANTPFTEPEQAEISSQIQQVKAYFKETYELTGDQIAEVEERLDQTERASRHMDRKDWLLLFNGALFSLILGDILPPQAVQHILLMTLHGLGHLFGIGGGHPPHIPHGG